MYTMVVVVRAKLVRERYFFRVKQGITQVHVLQIQAAKEICNYIVMLSFELGIYLHIIVNLLTPDHATGIILV